MKFFYKHLAFVFLFLALGYSLSVGGHSVQVGYCVSCTGELTLYVEHWHGTEDPNSTTMTIDLNINGVTSTVVGTPVANLQDISFANLPGCVNPITIFGSCPGNANTYNDWAVFKFPDLPYGVPIIITVQSGSTAFTSDGCGMYPASSPVIVVPFTNPPPVASDNDTVCGSGSASLTLTGFSGGIQWQSAPASGGPWTSIPGAISTPLATGTLTNTTFYRALETGACESNVICIVVNQAPVPNAGAGSYLGTGSGITSCPTSTPGNLGAANTAGYSYSWTPAAGLSSTSISNPTVLLTTPINKIYKVATTAFGCTSYDSVLVKVNPIPLSNAGIDITACFSNTPANIGTATTSGYTFSWSPALGLSNTAISNPTATLNVVGTKSYTVTTTALSCTSKDTIVIVVNPLPTATIAGTTAVCKNDFSPDITFTGAAGTTPYTFTYAINGGTSQTITTISGNSVTIAVPTSSSNTFAYSLVSVQDASSTACSQAQSGSAIVTINPLPTATIAGTTTICKNATAPNITFTGASATAPYTFTYTINGSAQAPITTISGNSISIPAPTSAAGTFVYALVSVKDASSTACSQSQSGSATVTVNPLPTATVSGTTAVCKNDASPIITFTGADATPPYTFTYTLNSGTNLTVSTSGGNSVSVIVPTNTASVYTYSLISVLDASSTACSQTQNGGATVTVNPLPTATITGTTAVCKNATAPGITFTGASATAPYTFTYTVNGVTQPTVVSTGNSVTVLVPTFVAGTFTYSLVSVMDASSTTCSQTQSGSATVIVNPLPTATITGTTEVCRNTPSPNITFTGASATAPYTFTYTINGGANQTVTTTGGNSVNVPVPTGTVGTFLYELVSVQDGSITSCSQVQSGSETVIVDPLPVANFDFTNMCLYQPVVFNDSSTVSSGTNVSFLWNFGDTSPMDTAQDPVYTYANAGTYTVTLVTTTNNGCKDTVAKNTVVHPNPNTQFSTANVCDGTPVGFNDLSTILSTDTLQSWRWNFGDGSPFNLYQSVSGGHLYDSASSYTVQLIVLSNFGCSDSITKVVVVNPNPDLAFSTNDTAGCELWCVNLNDLSSISSGSNATWLWNFGDGNSSVEPSHCYINDSVHTPLSFNVDLTVASDSGCISYLSKPNYITIYPKPVANFITQPEIETIMNPIISFIDASSGADFWTWDFGDGSIPFSIGLDSSSVITPSPYTYQDTGSYTIMLITSTQYSCVDTTYQKVFIGPDVAFYIPNAFSPNNDGMNDTFFPKGIFISKYEMTIFDRWGNSVFFSDDFYKPWDGKTNYGTEIAQPDIYIYTIKGTDIYRKKHSYKGIITLVK
ncbi:MAG: PKD domain-containing protein [Bacteroidota bacterium]